MSHLCHGENDGCACVCMGVHGDACGVLGCAVSVWWAWFLRLGARLLSVDVRPSPLPACVRAHVCDWVVVPWCSWWCVHGV